MTHMERQDEWRVEDDGLAPLETVALPAADPGFLREWRELAAASVEPNPFDEDWFLTPALDCFAGAATVEIAAYRSGGQLCGLMPLVAAPRYEGRPLPHWRNWMHANAFLGAPLVRPGHEAGFWSALLRHCDAAARSSLFLHLDTIPLEGPLFEALRTVCRAEKRRLGVVQAHERAVLDSPLGADAYREATLSAKRRKEMRRQMRQLSQRGEVSFASQEDDADIERWIEDFLQVEASGWKGEAASALDCDERTRTLFTRALREGARRGALIRRALLLDGRPIAMLVNFRQGPATFGFKTAFDDDYARYSPGVLLENAYLDTLDRPDLAWCDSCAAPDHPVMNHLWSGRRKFGRVSIGIGGTVRRALLRGLLFLENRGRESA